MTFLLASPFLIGFFLLVIILMSIMIEIEKSGLATTFFSIAFAFAIWNYWYDIRDWFYFNPKNAFLFIGAYVIVGIVWGIIKWKSYILKHERKFIKIKESFIEEKGDIGKNWNAWIDFLNRKTSNATFYHHSSLSDIIDKVTVSAKDKKALIISWISYWPMSLLATIFNDPVRRFFNWIYNFVSGTFQKMSDRSANRMTKGIEKFEDNSESTQK